jgi:sporulation protein YlmC with PRC-barrel domain
MKKLAVATVMTAALGALAAMDAPAQIRPTTPADRPTTSTWSHTQGLHDTRDIIGVRIKNSQGKNIGEIDALVLDPEDGKVTHAVVGVGGFLGIGEKHVIVPWSDVKVSMDHDRTVVNMYQPTLERAPRYERKLLTSDRDRTLPAASPATAPTDPKADKKPK